MTELDLYKFIQKHELEISWHGHDTLNLWIDDFALEDFSTMLDRCDADDGGISCHLQSGGIVVLNLLDICHEYDIEPENILARE